jgi:carboxymethylenebutenolidase
MAIVTDWAYLDTPAGTMRLYMARPQGGTAGPGVLVVHDAFGLTDQIQQTCQRFAEEGLVAIAPELYHGLSPRTAAYDDVAAAQGLRQKVSDEKVVDYLTTGLRFLGARGEVRSGLCAAVGFGTGGRDAFLLATRNPDVLALVAYAGALTSANGTAAPLDASAKLDAPTLLFFGEADETIPAEEVALVQETLLKQSKDFDVVTYPGAGQGFFCDAQPDRYHEESATDAWTRTVDFLYERLEG